MRRSYPRTIDDDISDAKKLLAIAALWYIAAGLALGWWQ